MKWTKNRPNKQGWYWAIDVRYYHVPSILHVIQVDGGLYVEEPNMSVPTPVDEFYFPVMRWAGPIPEPEHEQEDCDPA